MLIDSQFANLSDEARTRIKRLAGIAFSKLVVGFSTAVGAKLGEWAVEWLRGDEGEDDDPDEETPA